MNPRPRRPIRPRSARGTVAGGPRVVVVLGAVLVLACGLLSGCTGHRAGARDGLLVASVPARVSVQSRFVSGLGTVLTDARGHTLYMFPPDAGSQVACTGPCAGTWPSLSTTGAHPVAGAGVNAGALATRPDPNSGDLIVTYAGYPLYRYAGDLIAGTANGQALFLDGGPWYALTPAGNPVTTTPMTPAPVTTTPVTTTPGRSR